jgi:YD repeat-containing protein
MSKKDLSEADISAKFITPAVIAAGWSEQTQIQREVHFTKGQIHVRGKIVTRGKSKFADYVLYYQPNIPIAIIEAKDNAHSVGDGMQQALVRRDPQHPYNDDGTVLDRKNGAGTAILTYAYNHRGQVSSSTDALSNVTNYTYDLNGNQTSVSQGAADITYAYDGANQLCWQYLASSISGNGCASPPGGASTYSYGDDGQRTGMVDSTGTSS